DALAAKRRDHVRPGGVAEGRLDLSLFTIGHLRHVVQAAAADDAYRWIHVVCFRSRLRSLRPQPRELRRGKPTRTACVTHSTHTIRPTCPTYPACPTCPTSPPCPACPTYPTRQPSPPGPPPLPTGPTPPSAP